ncbi:hypothetical protein SK128_009696 [Halocaridina rubra]|uniref:Uncharacterized protein n=1 Tax=Halocaridina rubra TaxID=373956 RepID=A0AAN8ZY45_HALRR
MPKPLISYNRLILLRIGFCEFNKRQCYVSLFVSSSAVRLREHRSKGYLTRNSSWKVDNDTSTEKEITFHLAR